MRYNRYLVYRNGSEQNLQTLLQQALADFYQRFRYLPAEVVVPKSLLDQGKTALKDLGLPRLPMRGSGGCLLGEVWLGIHEKQTELAR